jgi:dolichol-phosphate mannosyltransferase
MTKAAPFSAPRSAAAGSPLGGGREASPPELSVVVPCYNEEGNVETLHRRVSAACREAVGEAYEIVLVNDGSRDATWPAIAARQALDPKLVAVDLSRNHGHQLALSAGLSVARGDKVLILDADLQDPPELLGAMLALMAEGHDVVYGLRVQRKGETVFKRWSSKLFYRVLRYLSDVPMPLDAGDFRLISRRVVDLLLTMPEQGRFLRGMIAWTGFSQVALPYTREPRLAGKSNYPLLRMIAFSMDAITAFSIRPLRIAVLLGASFGACGLLLLGYTFFSWATGAAVSGWTSLMAAVLLLGSAQLTVLGIIGEYVGRLVLESKGRPLFIIREVLGPSKSLGAAAGLDLDRGVIRPEGALRSGVATPDRAVAR